MPSPEGVHKGIDGTVQNSKAQHLSDQLKICKNVVEDLL